MRPGVISRSSASRRLLTLVMGATIASGTLFTVVPPSPARAAPVLGGQLFSTGSAIEVEVKPASAGLTSELWLLEPTEIFIATNRQVGTIVDVGPFTAGDELIFGIRVGGNEFRMGPGDRNPDGIVHATVDFISETTAIVGFEDLFGGGDRDYNDNVFEFRGGIAPEPPPPPEPEPEPEPGTPPVANAGPDQDLPEGSVVQLDATGSSDPSGGGLVPSEADANLPGGTALDVALDQLSPPEGGNQTLTGSAAIGKGTAVANTALVYVFDVSGSTLSGGGCGGDANGDGHSNNRIDCEVAAARALNQQAIASGIVAEVGLIGFASGGVAADLSPEAGVQSLTGPATDADASGVADVEQAMASVRTQSFGGSVGFSVFSSRTTGNTNTNFESGITAACALLSSSAQPNRLVVFLSDGENNAGANVATVLPCEPPATFHTFAAGPGVTCASSPSRGGLQTIAVLTNGTCTNVSDLSQLPDILEGVVGSRLTRLELTIDGGAPIDVSGAADPALPVDGPASIAVSYQLPALDDGLHQVCLTAFGTDAGGDGTVTTCSEVGGGGQLSYHWELIDAHGPPIVLSSASAAQPTFAAADDATYTFEVTVTNGFGLTDTDRVVVTVSNVAPTLTIESSEAIARAVTLVNASFTDPGWLDTHAARIDWGDGSEPDDVPVNAQGAGWGGFFGSHIYADAGSYTITVTVTDDDGGSSTAATAELSVAEPVAVWANAQTADKTLDWSGAAGSITGRVHTNGELRAVGDTKTIIGPSTYAGSLAADTDRHIFMPLPAPAPVQDFPFRFELSDYVPGGPVATSVGSAYRDMTGECDNGAWHAVNVVLDPGVYYADCDVQIDGSAVGGRITLAATGSIAVSGSRPAFEPYYDGLLFLAGDSGRAIDLAASDSRFLGYLFAEVGEIEVSGSNDRFFCGILGDRVDLAGGGITVRGAACGRPSSTTAGPLLVPSLGIGLTGEPKDVLPGATVNYRLTVTNDGGLLVVPGILGLENVDSDRATTAAYGYTLEYFSIPDGRWLPLASAAGAVDGYTPIEPLPTTGGLTLDARPNPFDGVTHPADGDRLLGASIEPGGFATWGYQALVELTPAQVALLMDASAVGGLRTQIEFELTPASVQVRRLFRYGADFVADVRALTGDVTNVEITSTRPTGDPAFLDSGTTPGLARLGPGDSVTIPDSYDVAVVAPPSDGESDAAYLGRLLAADGAQLFAAAFARATGGVGLLLAPQVHVGATEHAPVVEVTKDGPVRATAGATLDYDITVRNRGSVDATGVTLADTLDGAPLVTDPVPATLVPGQIATSGASHTVPANDPGGTVTNRAAATWTDAAGNAYGPLGDEVATEVQTPPDLSATLADSLAVDADGNGVISPGDTIAYEAVIRNDGDAPLTTVVLDLELDERATLDPTSVTTSVGTVADGTDPGDARVSVEIPSLSGHSLASVHFARVIVDPFDFTSAVLRAQGTVTSAELDPVLTDDPAQPGLADVTTTHVVIPAPLLVAALTDAVTIDRDGDGVASANDTLRYTATVENQGSAPGTDVSLMIAPDTNSTLVTGSVTASAGTIESGQGAGDGFVKVTLGSLASVTTLTVTFDARIADPFPAGADRLSVQGIVNADELDAPVLTDDPATAAEADPTVTILNFAGGPPGTGLPGPTIAEVAPAEGTSVTAPTTINAVLTPPDGETVDSWTVSYRLEGDSTRTQIATGTGATVEATLDPTVMANGAYVVEIEATASGGGVSVASTSVIVEGDLKLGRFQVTYQDLNVPVGGIPIQVLRTYDSFDKSRGDFGVGWRLGLANFRVATNGPLGAGGWTMFQCGGGLIFVPLCFASDRPHYVTVTWPDGRVETFDLTPAQGSTFLPGLTSATFTGRPGTTSKLAALDSGLYWSGDGNLYGGLFGSGGLYDPTGFRLTDKSGTEYVIVVGRGLVSARNRNGNTVTVTDAGIVSSLGPSITFDRDASGRIQHLTGPTGETHDYVYSNDGDLTAVTDAAGKTVTFDYDDEHNLVEIANADGTPHRTIVYDDEGRITSVTDGVGNTVKVQVDPDARTEIVTDPSGRLTTITTLDEFGNTTQVEEVFDGTSRTTSFEYDALGRMTKEVDPLGHASTFAYDERGNPTRVTDALGHTTRFEYEAGELKSIIGTDGTTLMSFERDGLGNPTAIDLGLGFRSTFTYSSAGKPLTATQPLGKTYTATYSAAGALASITDPGSNTISASYDDSLRPLSVESAGLSHTFTYDQNGNLASSAAGASGSWTYTYDEQDRLVGEVDPKGQSRTRTYDAAGRLVSIADRNGDTTRYVYDAASRVTEVQLPDGSSITYEYDGLGRLIAAQNSVARVELTYDLTNLVTRYATSAVNGSGVPSTTVEYAYDANGNRISMTTDAGVTEYEYDQFDRLAAITDPSGDTYSLSYDQLGRLKRLDRPGAITTDWDWSAAGQPTSITHAVAGVPVDEIGYTYDARGLVSAISDQSGTHTFTYDGSGQLTGADHPAGQNDEAYTYDEAGNRTSNASLHDAANRLTENGDEQFTWDPEGRLISRTDRSTGTVTTYAWDAESRLTAVTRDGDVTTYRYDPFGRLISTTGPAGSGYLSYGVDENPIAAFDGSGSETARYVFGSEIDMPIAMVHAGATQYFLQDATADVTAIVDGSGGVVRRNLYDSFGRLVQTTGSAPDPFTFAGRQYDAAAGAYWFRMRWYDPTIGRFLSEDPVPATNPYPYAANNPLAFRDPMGAQALIEYKTLNEKTEVQASRTEYSIYRYYECGQGWYYGMTSNLIRREAQHGSRILAGSWEPLFTGDVGWMLIRGIEQAFIDLAGLPVLANKINSMSPTNPVNAPWRAQGASWLDDFLARNPGFNVTPPAPPGC